MSRLAMILGLLCLLSRLATACFPASPPFVGVATDGQVYHNGKTAALALTVATKQKKPQTMDFASSKRYDFLLFPENEPNNAIWQWSQGRMFSQALTKLTLRPGESITFVVTTDFKLPSGDYPKPGRYLLQGVLCTRDKPVYSAPLTIEIR